MKPDARKPVRRSLLITPPVEEPFIRDRGGEDGPEILSGRSYAYPLPIGLLRIAGQLLREGAEVWFLDCFSSFPGRSPCSHRRRTPSAEPVCPITKNREVQRLHLGLTFDEIAELVRHVDVDEVLVGCTFTYHCAPAHRVIDLVKDAHPEVPVRFGGIYPTLAPESAQNSRADEVVQGAYPGIQDQSLDYRFPRFPPDFILVKGTSGCPHSCAYCAVHKLEGNQFRHRDPEEVADEIMAAHQEYGLIETGMWDSNILMQYDEYLGPILARLIDSGISFHVAAPEGLDYRLLTGETAEDLRRAGFRAVSLVLEAVDTDYAPLRAEPQRLARAPPQRPPPESLRLREGPRSQGLLHRAGKAERAQPAPASPEGAVR